jgi:hypothetical protein
MVFSFRLLIGPTGTQLIVQCLSVCLSVHPSIYPRTAIIHLPLDNDIADSALEDAATILAVNKPHQADNEHTLHKPLTFDKTFGFPTTMIPYLQDNHYL